MKKLFLLFAAFTFVTALSACDMFSPEDVEEISEEYCRDNPDSEICQGESVGDLQDDAILNVFNTILAEYNDPNQTTFCEDYFSVTNTELLDACRASRDGLFPEDVGDFTVEDVSKMASLSTVDRFEITVLSPDLQTRYVFEIGLVKIDGIMYINSWSFETETIDPTTLTVPFADAEAYLEQFLADYANDNITSTTICQTYLPDVDGCVTERDSALVNDFAATLENLSEAAGTYTATIEITDTEGSQTSTLTMTFAYDSTGDIVMTILDDGGDEPTEYTFEDYQAFLEDLFQDFFHSTRTPEDICASYFIPEDYDFCMNGYNEKETHGYTQEIGSFEPYEDHYMLMVNYIEGTAVTEQIPVEVWFHVTDDGLRVHFYIEDQGETQYDVFWNLLADFMNAYNNTALSDDAAVDPFFDEATAAEVKADRQSNLGDGVQLVLEDLYQDAEDNWFFVLNVEGGAPEDSETYGVVFFEQGGSWRMSLIDNDETDYDVYLAHVEAFFHAFNNPAISNDDAVDPFVDPMQADEMKAERDRVLATGDSVELNGLFQNEEDRWFLDMSLIEEGTPVTMTVEVFFYIDEFGALKMTIDMDGPADEYEFFLQHVESFFQSYNDPGLSDDEAVDPFIDPMQAADVKADRQDMLANGDWIEFRNLYQNEDGRWYIEIIFHEDTQTDSMQVEVLFFLDQNDQLKMTIKMETDPGDYDLYLQHLQAFFDAYANPALSDDEAVDPFFDPMQAPDIKLGRQDSLANGHTVELIALYINEAGMWVFDLVANAGDGDMHSTIPVEFYYDDNDQLKMRFLMGPNPGDDYTTYLEHLEAFVAAFNDTNLNNDMAISPFIDPMLFEELRQRRDELVFGADGHIELMQLYFDPSGDWWITLHIVVNGSIEVDTLPIGFYHDEADNLRMWIDFNGGDDFLDQRFVVEQFLSEFMDPTITTNTLCQRYFLDPTETACYDLRALFTAGMDAYYNGFFTPDGMVFEIDIELYDDVNGVVRRHWRVEFAIDNFDGQLKMIVLDNITTIDWDSAQAFLDAFIQQFNDIYVSDHDFATQYAADGFYDVLTALRFDYAGHRIVYYWLTEEYGKYWMAVEFDNGDTIRYDLVFHLMGDTWVAEFHPHQGGSDFTQDDIWMLADDIAWEFNSGITIDSLCTLFFGPDSMDRCRAEFQVFATFDGTIEVSNVWFNDAFWTVEYRILHPDGLEEYFVWNVVAFTDDFGNIRFDFQDTTLIPEVQMQQFLNNFILEFNSFGYDAQMLCAMYVAPDSRDGCIDLYNELMTTGQQLNLYSHELRFSPFWIEVMVYDPDGIQPEYYMQGEVQFFIDDNGQMWMNWFPGERYTHVDETEIDGILQVLISSINDLSTADEMFCGEWGHLFDNCFALRSQIRSGSLLVLADWYMMHSTEASVRMHRVVEGAVVEDLYFHFTIRQVVGQGLIIQGWQEVYNPGYTLADVEAAFAALLNAYFDPSWSNGELEIQFADGYYLPGIEYREDLLAMGYTVSLVGIQSVSYEYGFETFEAEILVIHNGANTTYTVLFNPMFDDMGGLLVLPQYDWMMPDEATVLAFLNEMVMDFNDDTISDVDLCLSYFDEWSAEWCIELRQQLQTDDLTMQLGFVERSDEQAYFDLEFYDASGTLLTTLTFGYYNNYNFLGEAQPSIFQQFDTIALDNAWDFLTMVVDQLRTGNLSVADFCAMYECNDMWNPEGRSIVDIELLFIEFDYLHIFDQSLRAMLYIEYNDNSSAYLELTMPYTIDSTGGYAFDLTILGIELPIPWNAVPLDQTATELVLDDFLADMVDPTVTAQELCTLYLGGSMMSPDCVEGRSEWLTNDTLITRSVLDPFDTADGITVYLVTFTFITNGATETIDTAVLVFQLIDGTHVLMFDDYYMEDAVE